MGDLPYYILGLPNIRIWMFSSYWADERFMPALHFWSLGVELQFYLLVPFILMLHRQSRLLLPVLLLLSLLACAIIQGFSAKTAFFMMPFRLWEFLAGYIVATLPDHAVSRRVGRYAGAIFLVAVAALFLLATVPISTDHFPWPFAVPAVIAAAACIAVGHTARSPMGRLLMAGFAYLGELSYSVYLVHFPVIFALRYRPLETDTPQIVDSASLTILAVVLTFVLAVILYGLVEQPFRKATYSWSVQGSLAAALLAAFVALPLGRMATQAGTTDDPTLDRAYRALLDQSPTFRCSLAETLRSFGMRSCKLWDADSSRGDRPTVLLVGNSHADALKEAMRDEAAARGFNLLLWKGNVPFGLIPAQRLRQEIAARDVDYVILHSSSFSEEEYGISSNELGKRYNDLLLLAEEMDFKVVVIDPVPTWSIRIPWAIYKNRTENENSPLPVQHVSEYLFFNKQLFDILGQVKSPKFLEIKIHDLFCVPKCRIVDDRGNVLYHDAQHLTLSGAEYLLGNLEQMFDFIKSDSDKQKHGL